MKSRDYTKREKRTEEKEMNEILTYLAFVSIAIFLLWIQNLRVDDILHFDFIFYHHGRCRCGPRMREK